MKLSRPIKYLWLCLFMICLLIGQTNTTVAAEEVSSQAESRDLLRPPGQLAAPIGLEAWAISPTYIYLQWEDTGGAETFFWIGRWSDEDQDYLEAGWTPADVTSFDDESVACDTTYFYVVYAGQEFEDGNIEWSEASNEVEVTTPPCEGESTVEEPTAGEETTGEPVGPAEGEVRYIDLTVSIYREPGEDRPAYEDVFGYLADAIYEMSNGAHKLRRVSFYTNFDYHDRANIIWLPGPPQGQCWPRAIVGGYYEPGATIEMCDFNDSEEPYLINDADRQNAGYTVAHEMGHYFYGLYDEYGGSSVAVSQPAPSFPQPEDTPVEQSIMNDQRNGVQGTTTLGWEFFGDYNWLNFSTSLNDTGNTANYRVFLASAWDVLARPPEEDPPNEEGLPPRPPYPELQAYAPLAGEPPTLELPDGQSEARTALEMVWVASGSGKTAWSGEPGHGLDSSALASMAGSLPDTLVDQAVQAEEATLDGVVRQLVIESSSSMSHNNRLDSVKAAAMQVVDNALVGDAIGVTAFDGAVSEVLPLTLITDETTKETIKAAIETITPGDDQAAIGEALQTALDGLQAAGIPEEIVQVVYLIADGPSTTGSDPLAVASAYAETFVAIYTFGYNTGGRSADLLQGLADQTGGLYSFVDSYESLSEGLDNAEADVTPYVDVIINSDYGLLSGGDSVSIPMIVDSTLGGVIIEIYYTGAPETASLVLLDPDGVQAEGFECLSEGEGDEEVSLCLYGLEAPTSGVWTIDMTANSDLFAVYQASGLEYEEATTYYATAYSLNGYEVIAPDPLLIEGFVFQEDLITGAVMEGFIEAPDGTFTSITLQDDGQGPDAIAEDGFYAAEFTPTMDGDYYVTIHFDNSNGEAKFTEYGLLLSAGKDGKQPAYREPWPVEENFERAAEFQVVVSGYGNVPSAPPGSN